MKKIQLSLIWAGLSSLALFATGVSGANQQNSLEKLPNLSVTIIPSNSNSSGFRPFSYLNSLSAACSISLNTPFNPSQTLTVSSNDSTVTIGTFSTSNISGFVTITFPLDPTATTASCKVPCAVQFTQTSAGLISSIYFIGTSSNGLQTQTSNIPISTQAF